MLSLRSLTRSHWVQRATGIAAAHYLRLVWKTTRFSVEPGDVYERLPNYAPLSRACGHGPGALTRISHAVTAESAQIALGPEGNGDSSRALSARGLEDRAVRRRAGGCLRAAAELCADHPGVPARAAFPDAIHQAEGDA